MAGFSRQGYTGGPFNMDGRREDGTPAAIRSEAVDFERARREMVRNPAYSILGAMVNPQGASLADAIRANLLRKQIETGYSPGITGYQPGQPLPEAPAAAFGSLIPPGAR